MTPGGSSSPFLSFRDALFGDLFEHRDLPRGHFLDLVDLLVDARILVLQLHALQVAGAQLLDQVPAHVGPLGEQLLVGLLVVQVGQEFLAFEQGGQALGALVVQNALFVFEIPAHALFRAFQNQLGPLVELRALAREHLAIDDGSFDARRAVERCVLDVAGLFAEDRAQEFFFRSQLRFALGSDLADQDVARFHRGADADDAALVEVREEAFGDIRNIARDFLRTQLGVAGVHFEFLDVDGGVVVVLDQLLGHHDGVLEVVAAPRHERDQNVPAQRQLAALGAGTVGQHVALLDLLALEHDRLLVDAGVLIGALELGELVDVGAHFARKLPFLAVAFHAHDDALAVDRVHHAGALAQHHGAGIARGHVLHAGADVRSLGAQQRNGLALHVRSHERAVGVVVFKERDQARGHRHQLLGTDVHVLDFAHVLQDEVAGLAGVHQLGRDLALFVQADVGLGDDVLVFFPGRKIVAVRLELDGLLLARIWLTLSISPRSMI